MRKWIFCFICSISISTFAQSIPDAATAATNYTDATECANELMIYHDKALDKGHKELADWFDSFRADGLSVGEPTVVNESSNTETFHGGCVYVGENAVQGYLGGKAVDTIDIPQIYVKLHAKLIQQVNQLEGSGESLYGTKAQVVCNFISLTDDPKDFQKVDVASCL